jgi:hypothetical protein
VESSLSLDLWIHILTEDTTAIHVFEIQSPSGQIFAFPKFDAGLIYFSLRGPRETGVWSYRIRLYPGGVSGRGGGSYGHMLLECWAAGVADQVVLTSWSQIDMNGGGGRQLPAIILYAQLEQAGLPVLQAEMTARVHSSNSKAAPVRMVHLVDDGSGYPDITRGDGIYSAYFTEFSLGSSSGGSSTIFSFEVEATNNGTAAVLNSRRSSEPLFSSRPEECCCCGSTFPTEPTIPLESFRRYSTATSFQLASPVVTTDDYNSGSGGNNNNNSRTGGRRQQTDPFPPRRISDFRLANYFNNSLFVTLAWTAPGDDLDGGGPAFRYEIRCFTERAALGEANFAEQGILVHASLVPQPGEPGREQRSTVAVPWAREVFYYAIVAVDAAGNRGEVSNIIALMVEEPVVTEAPSVASSENATLIYLNMEDLNNENNMMLQSVLQSDGLMYIIAGVISFILIVIVLILVVIIKRLGVCCGGGGQHTKKQNPSSANESLEDEETVDTSVYMPDICQSNGGGGGGSFTRNSVSYVSGYDLADNLEFTLRSPQKATAQEVTNNNNNNHHQRFLLDPRYYCDSLAGCPKPTTFSLSAGGNAYAAYQTSVSGMPSYPVAPPSPTLMAAAGQSPSISPVNSTYTAHSTDCSVSVTSSSDPDQPAGGGGESGGLQVLAATIPTAGGGQLQVLPTSGHHHQLPYLHPHESIGGRGGHRRSEMAANRSRKVPPAVPNKTVHASLV